jgi:hypothetical protein
MHALACAGRTFGQAFNLWAIELAKTAHARFTYTLPGGGGKSLYWKMNIDLSYPLVSSMGHHDPLDGLITYSELRATEEKYPGGLPSPDLGAEIAEMAEICERKSWTTDDPLGIGGLLSGACRMAQLITEGSFTRPDLLEPVLDDALTGLGFFVSTSQLKLPAEARLAFRELGLSIGLQSIERMQELLELNAGVFRKRPRVRSGIQSLMQYAGLSEQINTFWLDSRNRECGSWTDHRGINMVMLATSLSPDGYLSSL